MKKLILLSIVLLSLLVAPLSELSAQARLINYQGNVLNQSNIPFEGPVQITFELYSAEFGGSQVWSEIQNVTMNAGYFNVYLGSVSPFPANFNFNRDLWLQVTVGKGSPYQRTMLSMVPYSGFSEKAARAGFADTVADASITLAKLAAEVINMGPTSDLIGQLPNPKLRPGAILENIPDGSITQVKLSPNVTTRPSGPASGDLTGFYPDPLIAVGAVKTDRIADGAVTNEKLADFTIKYSKLQNATGPIGTILGWDGTKWVETSISAWEKGRIKAIVAGDGAYVNNVVDGEGFLTTTVGIANDGVTNAKIANQSVTYNKLQNAVGAAGTILGWNGTQWVETTVSAMEADGVIGNEVLNATPNRGLVRDGLGTAASPYTLGIAAAGVQNDMIAPGAVSLSNLAPGTTIGQIMWWDVVSNSWRLSTGPAPVQDKVIKWVNTGATLEPQWANDDMTIPFEKTITENAVPLFSLTNNGDSDVMNLATTGNGNGLVLNMIDDTPGGGSALVLNGGGLNAPSILVNRNSDYGFANGVAAINASITSLDASSMGLFVNTLVNDDGNNNYNVQGVRSNLTVNNGVSTAAYVSMFGQVESTTGIAIGVLGDADAFSNGTNVGVHGDANNSSDNNIGVIGSSNIDWQDVINNLLVTGLDVGVLAVNNGGTFDDNALIAVSAGNGDASIIQAEDASAVVALNNSDFTPTVFALNQGDGTAFAAVSANTDDFTAVVENFGTGRGLGVTGGKANDENGGMPFWNDANDDDDAALVVYNPNAMSLGGSAPWATAIKTYGDIWANSAVGANEIIALNKVIVGNPFIGPFFEILPPAFPGAPLVMDGDVQINGNLDVQDITANDIFANDLVVNNILANDLIVNDILANNIDANVVNAGVVNAGVLNAAMGSFDNLQVNFDANVDGNTTLGGTLGVTGATTLGNMLTVAGATTINNTLNVTGLTTLAGVNATNGSFSGTLGVTGATTLGNMLTVAGATQINNNLGVTGNATIGGSLTAGSTTLANLTVTGTSNLQGAATLGSSLTVAGATQINNTLGVTGHTSLSTLGTSGLATLNSAAVVNNATVGGTLGVTGHTSLSTLGTSGLATLNSAAVVNNATVGGTLGVTGHTTLSTLTTSGLATLNSAAVVNNATVGGTLGVTGATTLNNTLAVAGAASFANDVNLNGSNLNISNGTRFVAGGTPGVAGELFVSRGAALSPQWTNTIPQLTVTGTLTAQDLQVNNNAIIGGDLTVNGADVFINADVTMVGDFDLTGALVADEIVVLTDFVSVGNFDVFSANPILFAGPSLDLAGDFNVLGNTDLIGTLAVSGATTIGGATQINNTLGVTGNTLLGANLQVNGTSDLRGTIFNTELGGGNEINIIDNTNITGNLVVSGGPGQGLITGKDLLISQSATINQNLTVNQNATINQNFTVGGLTSVNDVNVTGDIINPTIGMPVNVEDDLRVANDLDVVGSVTIGGGLIVLGDITANNLNAIIDVNAGVDVNAGNDVNAAFDVNALAGDVNALLGDVNAIDGNFTGNVTANVNVNAGLDVNAGSDVNAVADVNAGIDLNAMTGNVNALLGNVNAINGNFTGDVNALLGDVNAIDGNFTGDVNVLTGDVTAMNFNGNLVGGTVSGTTGMFTGDVTALNFNGNLVGGTVSGTTGMFTGDVTAVNFNGNLVGGTVTATTGTFTGGVTVLSLASNSTITAVNDITTSTGNLVATLGNVVAVNGNFSNDVNALTGDVNAIDGNFTGVVNQTSAGLNNFNGDLNVGGAATFNSSLLAFGTVNADEDLKVRQQASVTPLTGVAGLDWSQATLFQRVSFVEYTGIGGAITNNPEASAGAFLYIFNNGGGILTFNTAYGVVNIGMGQMAHFININGGSSNWKLVAIN